MATLIIKVHVDAYEPGYMTKDKEEVLGALDALVSHTDLGITDRELVSLMKQALRGGSNGYSGACGCRRYEIVED